MFPLTFTFLHLIGLKDFKNLMLDWTCVVSITEMFHNDLK